MDLVLVAPGKQLHIPAASRIPLPRHTVDANHIDGVVVRPVPAIACAIADTGSVCEAHSLLEYEDAQMASPSGVFQVAP